MAGSYFRSKAVEIEAGRARAGLPVGEIGPEAWGVICDEMSQHGNLRKAAAAAGTEPRFVRRAAQADPDYAQLLEDARQDYAECTLVPEAHRRAVEGVDKGVYFQGIRVATEAQYSDGLLMELLKVHDHRFRPHQIVENKPSNAVSQDDLDRLPPDERQALEAFLAIRAANAAKKANPPPPSPPA